MKKNTHTHTHIYIIESLDVHQNLNVHSIKYPLIKKKKKKLKNESTEEVGEREEFHVVMQKNMANPGRDIKEGEDAGWSL